MPALIDFEVATSHRLELSASVPGLPVWTRNVTIRVVDENEFKVSEIEDTDGSRDGIASSATNGDLVGVTALASDADQTDNVRYSLGPGTSGPFAVDPETGVVTVTDVSLIDLERPALYEIEVIATSSDMSSSSRLFSVPAGATQTELVTSTLLNFDLTVHNASASAQQVDTGSIGGGLAAVDDGVLIARSQLGLLYFFDRHQGRIHLIRPRLPENNYLLLPDKTEFDGPVQKHWHRYNDVEVITRNGDEVLLVSYTHFDPERVCFTNRLAELVLAPDWHAPHELEGFVSPAFESRRPETALADLVPRSDGWQVVFETDPCLYFHEASEGSKWRWPMPAHQAGGRIAVAADGLIYLTVGDFGFDGRKEGPVYPQDTVTSYGKSLLLDPQDWSVAVYSIGHRNSQGITVDDQGRIWSVEHSTMGGDELNLLRPGSNHGWPYVNLGVNYTQAEDDSKSWPLNAHQGRHENYERPVFAWIPSVGVSNVKQILGVQERWDGDLLVSSLSGRSLHRIRVIGEDVIFEERIKLNRRVRYVDVANGEIYLLFDNGRFATLIPRPPGPVGATTYAGMTPNLIQERGCLECHADADDPQLSAVFGAEIASQPNIDYSAALQSIGGTWDRAQLTRFLADTQSFAPGTTMPRVSLTVAEIDAVVAELEQVAAQSVR